MKKQGLDALFISYYPEGEAFTYVELSGENPPVWVFHGSDEIDTLSFNLLANSFTGFIRESIIAAIKSFPSKYPHVHWAKADLITQNWKDRHYRKKREAFRRHIEINEQLSQRFLSPDEFQEEWINSYHPPEE